MPGSDNSDAPPDRPRIWALLGARTGDNRQVSTLAGALGGIVEEKILDYSALRALPHCLIGATLRTVKQPARAQLHPPWPDLVVASGRRSVAPARWIREQSGGRTKLVQLGRPRAPLQLFDLVITTAQYGLPAADNVLTLTLPLQTPAQPEDRESEIPLAGLSGLPRPWTGVLIGGTTWPFVLDSRAGYELAADLNGWAGRFGGSILATTSPRSDSAMADALEKTLTVPHFLHRWAAGSGNPYDAILREADRLVVTGDSVSMLADAHGSGKPVAVWKTGVRKDPFSRLCLALGNQANRETLAGKLLRYTTLKGLFTPPRHVERLTAAFIAAKRASWFDPDRPIESLPVPAEESDLGVAISRVRALFDKNRQG